MAVKPYTFWCNTCHRWTAVIENPENENDFWCGRCGEEYLCDECGYDIDRKGYCQRESCVDHQ